MKSDNKLDSQNTPEEATGVRVIRIDVPVMEPLWKEIKARARKEGLSGRRWVAHLLARYFKQPIEKAVPPLGDVGRPPGKIDED